GCHDVLPRADGLTRCYRVSIGQRARLEHAVAVGGFLRDRLDYVPMLDHLAVLELENVDDGVAARARLAHGMDMDDNVIAVGEDALDLAAVVRELVLQEGDEALEAFAAVGRQRIVLGIAGAEILRGFLEVLLVERGVVEGGDDFLVLLHLPGVGAKRRTRHQQRHRGEAASQQGSDHDALLVMSKSHFRGQLERDDGKRNQDDQAQDIGDDERQHAVEDGRNLHVLHHAFYHEDVHADRRVNEAELDRHHDDHPEPDRVESELFDDGKDDRDGDDDHGERVHEASQHQVHDHDQREHAVAPNPDAGQKLGDLLRRLGDGEELAEQDGADQDGEARGGHARGLEQRIKNAGP